MRRTFSTTLVGWLSQEDLGMFRLWAWNQHSTSMVKKFLTGAGVGAGRSTRRSESPWLLTRTKVGFSKSRWRTRATARPASEGLAPRESRTEAPRGAGSAT